MGKLLIGLFAAGRLGKIALTGGTMLLSVIVYAFTFGWWYAVGFVLLIFVHEMGHYIAAKQKGLNVGAPTFIPFVGAWIQLKDQPHNAETEAYVGLAGPLVGTLGALACYVMARQTDSNLLLALAYAGFFINLFNLIPLSPFDGGRITAVLSPRVWLLGVPVLVALFFYRPSPMLVLVGLLAAPQVMEIRPEGPGERRLLHDNSRSETDVRSFLPRARGLHGDHELRRARDACARSRAINLAARGRKRKGGDKCGTTATTSGAC